MLEHCGRNQQTQKIFFGNISECVNWVYKFRRQQPIGVYIVDFVCLGKRLIIELDGGQHTEQTEYDEKRSVWLRERGYRILGYWKHDVLRTPDIVMVNILEEIEKGK